MIFLFIDDLYFVDCGRKILAEQEIQKNKNIEKRKRKLFELIKIIIITFTKKKKIPDHFKI